MTIEDWEKDFTGLEKLREIKRSDLSLYKQAAEKIGMRLEFKGIEVWTPKDEDLTLFWKALKKFQ